MKGNKISIYFNVLILLCFCACVHSFLVDKMVANGNINYIHGVDIVKCGFECLVRTRCKSVNYISRLNFCELNEFDKSDGSLVTKPGYLYVEKASMEKPRSWEVCEAACGLKEVCRIKQGQLTCVVEECYPPPTIQSARILGNCHHVGARVLYQCEPGMKHDQAVTNLVAQSTCQSDGTWSNVNIKCKAPTTTKAPPPTIKAASTTTTAAPTTLAGLTDRMETSATKTAAPTTTLSDLTNTALTAASTTDQAAPISITAASTTTAAPTTTLADLINILETSTTITAAPTTVTAAPTTDHAAPTAITAASTTTTTETSTAILAASATTPATLSTLTIATTTLTATQTPRTTQLTTSITKGTTTVTPMSKSAPTTIRTTATIKATAVSSRETSVEYHPCHGSQIVDELPELTDDMKLKLTKTCFNYICNDTSYEGRCSSTGLTDAWLERDGRHKMFLRAITMIPCPGHTMDEMLIVYSNFHVKGKKEIPFELTSIPVEGCTLYLNPEPNYKISVQVYGSFAFKTFTMYGDSQ